MGLVSRETVTRAEYAVISGPQIHATSHASLTAAIATIGSTEADLLIDNTTTCTANTTVPNNIRLIVTRKGRINQSTYTLAINGPFEAGLSQVFTGSGTVTFPTTEYERKVCPQWWGAYNDGTHATETTAAIQAAVNASSYVTFPTGHYLINDNILITEACIFDLEWSKIESNNAAKDVFYFHRAGNGYATGIKNGTTVGGLSSVRIDGGFVAKTSFIENVKLTSAAHSGLRIEGGSTFISGVIKNLAISNAQSTPYGVYVYGYNCLNAVQMEAILIEGCNTACHIEDTTSQTISLGITGLTVEGVGGRGLYLKGVNCTITDFYSEQCGELTDTADIVLSSAGGTIPTRLTLNDPYFGPRGAAQTTSHVVSFQDSAISLSVFGKLDVAAWEIDGNGQTSASFINLFGEATGYTVVNFSHGRVGRYDSDSFGIKNQIIQNFVLRLESTGGGVTQHAITGTTLSLDSIYSDKITGASKTLQNTPSVSAVVDFVTGVGIWNAATNSIVFNTADQLNTDVLLTASIIYNDTGTALVVYPATYTYNVNGVSRERLLLDFTNAASGAAFNLTALGTSKVLRVLVQAIIA